MTELAVKGPAEIRLVDGEMVMIPQGLARPKTVKLTIVEDEPCPSKKRPACGRRSLAA
jgi:hypothetical protein